MAQAGAAVDSPLTLLEETISAVRALLSGDLVQLSGRYVKVDGIQLVHPPAAVPPLLAGVMKPRSLRLSGRIADGTILAEGSPPDSVTAALGTIAAQRAHQLVVLAFLCMHDDPAVIRAAMSPIRREFAQAAGVSEDEIFVLGGTEATVVAGIRSLFAAGATSVVLRPMGMDPAGMVERTITALDRAVGP
jgi:alkanesulfonate monooxygenase SsuD/methylene tetrahydromethanopterin reductase-like flavin-dependent oxidoreductase (luciferase family)